MFVKLQMCVKCVQNGRALRVGGVGCLNTAQQPGLGQAAPHQHIFSSHAAALELLLYRRSAVQLLRGSCTHVFP